MRQTEKQVWKKPGSLGAALPGKSSLADNFFVFAAKNCILADKFYNLAERFSTQHNQNKEKNAYKIIEQTPTTFIIHLLTVSILRFRLYIVCFIVSLLVVHCSSLIRSEDLITGASKLDGRPINRPLEHLMNPLFEYRARLCSFNEIQMLFSISTVFFAVVCLYIK